MNRRRIWPLLGLALLLSGCAEVDQRDPPAPSPAAKPTKPPAAKLESQPLKYLVGRKLAPQPTRPLNVRSRCSHRDALGTRTHLDLLVKNAEVKTFSAEIDIPKHGICRFTLNSLKQREKMPQVLLVAKDGQPCSVRMWEEPYQRGTRVTIAFNSCPAACAGDTFDYLWPILVDAKTGRCF